MSHISPNNAEPGSFVYTAEAWLLAEGFLIPVEQRHRHLFQGMLDDFSESDAARHFEDSDEASID